jgi:heterodisulfide reductase subunit A-like polyferredoxin
MAQLDKTFPTNDCSMCILAPKLVEAGRHHNIELVTNSRVEKVEGEAGDFKVSMKVTSRYVDQVKCTGCAECVKVCPVDVPNEFEENLSTRKAIYRLLAQAVPHTFAIDKRGVAPCHYTCPAGVNAHGYVALIRAGKYAEALALERERNPFPGVCGRVCTHPCEKECLRGQVDEPVAIASLKRFLADYEVRGGGIDPGVPERRYEERVAVVGAGPGGLTCAHDVAKRGYGVTVFEALPVAGGMLAGGIPQYRLPRAVLDYEVDYFRKLGIEIRLNSPVGKDLTLEDLKRQGYGAIFLATGAWTSLKLDVPGEEAEGVVHCIPFLRAANLGKELGEEVWVGRRVAVVGGGNAAVDSARTALRLGAQAVTIVYRRTRAEMPANPWEVDAALAEGVRIDYLAAPVRVVVEGGRVVGMECLRMELGAPDSSGRRRPVPVAGSEFILEVEMVIPAISQAPDLGYLGEGHGFKLTKWNTLAVDGVSLATSVAGVFAGGDVVNGPATVIEAIAQGREAAESIHRYLRGEDLVAGRTKDWVKATEVWRQEVQRAHREHMGEVGVTDRVGDFREVEAGYTEEQAKAEASRCLDCGVCSECMECVKVCQPNAIVHELKDTRRELQVGSIILAPGFDEFDARLKGEYGYGRFPNVVTSIEFERILSASGPYQGRILRPSDREHPKRIAFIQCVGSRDPAIGIGYCSSVCCMYATKEAVIAKEHERAIEPTIFFMDMRTFGKGFEQYYERAQRDYGLRYVRCMISSIKELPGSRDLQVRYIAPDGQMIEEEFDLVVLSVGLRPPRDAQELATTVGIRLNNHGFCETPPFAPVATSRTGVFVCGLLEGPKDIPETVMQASAAAAAASGFLSEARGSLVTRKEYPPEQDLRGTGPRIGAFICHCGINIGGIVKVPEVVEYVRTLPNVVYVEENLFTCSPDALRKIQEAVKEHKLTRIMVASCSPRTHEPLFQETIREVGLNRYLFEMANIRDQCSWVHMQEPAAATEKSKDLARMAIAKARKLEPLARPTIPVTHKGLVVGGGIAGLTAALGLSQQGYEVYVLEKEQRLGGLGNRIQETLSGRSVQTHLAELTERAEADNRIHLYIETAIESISGYVGNFKTTFAGVSVSRGGRREGKGAESGLERHEIEHGVIIVATGAEELKPAEYLYGTHPGVLTQLEFEERFADTRFPISAPRCVVMIQCVGSREPERPYCSRICCGEAVKNALRLKDRYPEAAVYILYREMRTYGFMEDYYQRAREKGIIFIRFDLPDKPEVASAGDSLRVTLADPAGGQRIELTPDLLILSVATVPRVQNKDLAQMLKVPLNQEGFYLEAHVKLRPVDFATEGIYVCGLAHGPKLIEESISQAQAAVSRACTVLAKERIEAEGQISRVNKSKCSGCGLCVMVCPYNAISLDEKECVAVVNEALCKGCGACAASCRMTAIDLMGFTNEEIYQAIDALAEELVTTPA